MFDGDETQKRQSRSASRTMQEVPTRKDRWGNMNKRGVENACLAGVVGLRRCLGGLTARLPGFPRTPAHGPVPGLNGELVRGASGGGFARQAVAAGREKTALRRAARGKGHAVRGPEANMSDLGEKVASVSAGPAERQPRAG